MKQEDKFHGKFNKGYFIAMLLVFIFLLPSTVMAHTGLVETTPKDGDIVKEELKKITMKFEAKVENLSTFKVINENNQTIDISSPNLEGNIMEGSFTEPLPNGSYKVQWNIVGTDGHPIKGEFSFTVEKTIIEPIKTETPSSTLTPIQTENPKIPAETKPQINLVPVEKVEAPLANTNSRDRKIITIAIVGFLVAGLLILSSIWVLKRGQKNK